MTRFIIEYEAALFGMVANQKSVLTWVYDNAGQNLIHEGVADVSMEALRNTLTSHGLEFRTLIPTEGRQIKFIVYDEGVEQMPQSDQPKQNLGKSSPEKGMGLSSAVSGERYRRRSPAGAA